MRERPATDGEEISCRGGGQEWSSSWHPPGSLPDGTRHGSAGICIAEGDQALLISSDGVHWDLPGGRPEGAETWEETLRREVLEEACATVRAARLLGFVRGRCVQGHEAGLVLVRSLWLAQVSLSPWQPAHEIAHRKLVPAAAVLEHVTVDRGFRSIYRRALQEAGVGR